MENEFSWIPQAGRRVFIYSSSFPRVPNAISSAAPLPSSSLVVNFQDDAHKIQQLCAQLCGFEGHFGGERDGGEAPKMRERGIPRREEGEEKGGAGAPPRETRRSIRLINSLICPPTRALRCAGCALDRITV